MKKMQASTGKASRNLIRKLTTRKWMLLPKREQACVCRHPLDSCREYMSMYSAAIKMPGIEHSCAMRCQCMHAHALTWRPGLAVSTNLLASMEAKIYFKTFTG